MHEPTIIVGQRFEKTDGTGMVFEVAEHVKAPGLPHVRIAHVGNPSDLRLVAASVLSDRNFFRPTCEGMLRPKTERVRLRLMPA